MIIKEIREPIGGICGGVGGGGGWGGGGGVGAGGGVMLSENRKSCAVCHYSLLQYASHKLQS